MIVLQFADKGNLRNVLSSNFNNILWNDKIRLLYNLSYELKRIQSLGLIHKKLAYRCMDANPNQRPTTDKLYNALKIWHDSIDGEFNYKGKEIKYIFEEADKEIPNISTLYEKDNDAICTSKAFTFNNLPK